MNAPSAVFNNASSQQYPLSGNREECCYVQFISHLTALLRHNLNVCPRSAADTENVSASSETALWENLLETCDYTASLVDWDVVSVLQSELAPISTGSKFQNDRVNGKAFENISKGSRFAEKISLPPLHPALFKISPEWIFYGFMAVLLQQTDASHLSASPMIAESEKMFSSWCSTASCISAERVNSPDPASNVVSQYNPLLYRNEATKGVKVNTLKPFMQGVSGLTLDVSKADASGDDRLTPRSPARQPEKANAATNWRTFMNHLSVFLFEFGALDYFILQELYILFEKSELLEKVNPCLLPSASHSKTRSEEVYVSENIPMMSGENFECADMKKGENLVQSSSDVDERSCGTKCMSMPDKDHEKYCSTVYSSLNNASTSDTDVTTLLGEFQATSSSTVKKRSNPFPSKSQLASKLSCLPNLLISAMVRSMNSTRSSFDTSLNRADDKLYRENAGTQCSFLFFQRTAVEVIPAMLIEDNFHQILIDKLLFWWFILFKKNEVGRKESGIFLKNFQNKQESFLASLMKKLIKRGSLNSFSQRLVGYLMGLHFETALADEAGTKGEQETTAFIAQAKFHFTGLPFVLEVIRAGSCCGVGQKLVLSLVRFMTPLVYAKTTLTSSHGAAHYYQGMQTSSFHMADCDAEKNQPISTANASFEAASLTLHVHSVSVMLFLSSIVSLVDLPDFGMESVLITKLFNPFSPYFVNPKLGIALVDALFSIPWGCLSPQEASVSSQRSCLAPISQLDTQSKIAALVTNSLGFTNVSPVPRLSNPIDQKLRKLQKSVFWHICNLWSSTFCGLESSDTTCSSMTDASIFALTLWILRFIRNFKLRACDRFEENMIDVEKSDCVQEGSVASSEPADLLPETQEKEKGPYYEKEFLNDMEIKLIMQGVNDAFSSAQNELVLYGVFVAEALVDAMFCMYNLSIREDAKGLLEAGLKDRATIAQDYGFPDFSELRRGLNISASFRKLEKWCKIAAEKSLLFNERRVFLKTMQPSKDLKSLFADGIELRGCQNEPVSSQLYDTWLTPTCKNKGFSAMSFDLKSLDDFDVIEVMIELQALFLKGFQSLVVAVKLLPLEINERKHQQQLVTEKIDNDDLEYDKIVSHKFNEFSKITSAVEGKIQCKAATNDYGSTLGLIKTLSEFFSLRKANFLLVKTSLPASPMGWHSGPFIQELLNRSHITFKTVWNTWLRKGFKQISRTISASTSCAGEINLARVSNEWNKAGTPLKSASCECLATKVASPGITSSSTNDGLRPSSHDCPVYSATRSEPLPLELDEVHSASLIPLASLPNTLIKKNLHLRNSLRELSSPNYHDPPIFLRQCLQRLTEVANLVEIRAEFSSQYLKMDGNSSGKYVEEPLQRFERIQQTLRYLPTIIARSANSKDLDDICVPLCDKLIGLESDESDRLEKLKYDAVFLLFVKRPRKLIQFFSEQFFNAEWTTSQRVFIIKCVQRGVRSLSRHGFVESNATHASQQYRDMLKTSSLRPHYSSYPKSVPLKHSSTNQFIPHAEYAFNQIASLLIPISAVWHSREINRGFMLSRKLQVQQRSLADPVILGGLFHTLGVVVECAGQACLELSSIVSEGIDIIRQYCFSENTHIQRSLLFLAANLVCVRGFRFFEEVVGVSRLQSFADWTNKQLESKDAICCQSARTITHEIHKEELWN